MGIGKWNGLRAGTVRSQVGAHRSEAVSRPVREILAFPRTGKALSVGVPQNWEAFFGVPQNWDLPFEY